MVFNISIGFTNLKNKSAKEEANKIYGLFLGETVAIGDKDSPATVLTTSKKQMKNIGMFLKVCWLQYVSNYEQVIQILSEYL